MNKYFLEKDHPLFISLKEWCETNHDVVNIPPNYDPKISSAEAIKRNTEIVQCDRCGIKGGRPNMMRWHFENCKTTFKNCLQCNEIINRQGVKQYAYNKMLYCDQNCYMKSKKGIPVMIMTDEIKHKLSVKAKEKSEMYSEMIKKNKPWLKSRRNKK